MTAAFQVNAFQGNAFQTLIVTGTIDATDNNDTGLFIGEVAGGETVDTHDGFTYKEIKHLENIRKKLEKLREKEAQEFADKNEKRKNTIKNVVDPKKIAKVKKVEVELVKINEQPKFDREKLLSDIAKLEAQYQLAERQLMQKQALQAYQNYMAYLEAQIQAEREDEEALLMLL